VLHTDTSERGLDLVAVAYDFNFSSFQSRASFNLYGSKEVLKRFTKRKMWRTRPVATVPRPEMENTSKGRNEIDGIRSVDAMVPSTGRQNGFSRSPW
jgi:hypothetical protein